MQKKLSIGGQAVIEGVMIRSQNYNVVAVRKGNKVNAERHYKDALSLNPNDNYLLASYSDFLLDENKPGEVINLLKGKTKSDSLFLRLIIAEKKMNSPNFESHTNELKTRSFLSGVTASLSLNISVL